MFLFQVDSGVVLLLRYSIDDTNPGVRSAGIAALASLMGHEAMEVGVMASQPWAGNLRPGIASDSHAQDQVRQELAQEETELKDTELLQLDVIKALLRIDTHVRLLYTIEHLSPPTESVLHIISILSRIACHSCNAAWTLTTTPGLLPAFVKRFLPSDISKLLTGENVSQMTSVEGVPLRHLLAFIRILCGWDKSLALTITKDQDIFRRILPYVSQDPSEVALPLSEAMRLSVETYSLWSLLLGYGLPPAQQAFISFRPLLVRQLQFYRDKVSINEDTGSNQLNFDIGAYMLQLLSHALSVSSSKQRLLREMRCNEALQVALGSKSELLQAPLIEWSDMLPIIDLVVTCGRKWFHQLQKNKTTFSGLKLLGELCNFLQIYLIKSKDVEDISLEKLTNDVGHFYNGHLVKFLGSESLRDLLDRLPSHSALCSGFLSGTCEDAKNLSSLTTVTFDKKGNVRNFPLLQQSSPFPLLLPLSSLLHTIHMEFPSISSSSTLSLVNHPSLLSYLTKVSKMSLKSHWFTRIEARFLTHICFLAQHCTSQHRMLYHGTAISAMACLQKGQEFFGRQLLTEVLLKESMMADVSDVSSQVKSMTFYEPLKSPALFEAPFAPLQMVNRILGTSQEDAKHFASLLLEDRDSRQSVIWCKDIFFMNNSIGIEHSESWNIVDQYWLLLPLKKLMLEKIIKMSLANEQQTNKGDQIAVNQSTPEQIRQISLCLQFTYLFITFRKEEILKSTEITGWLRHLSLVFLVADDLFLDRFINSLLQGSLRELLSNGGHKLFDDKLQISGLGNTFDWYKKLLEQYIAVSYGDSTFALILLVPAQMLCPLALRSLLWGDLSDALSLIRLKASDIQKFMPVEAFLEPHEEDPDMLMKYQSALATGVLTERRSPFLFSVAVHHLERANEREASKRS